jgi:4-hydroxybenzoyl-CoA thioesterase
MLTNRRTIAVEWGHCDPAGIVFFPRYFEWFDACTAALFEAAGFEKRALREAFGIAGIPLVDARARFLRPSSFGDTVVVESRVARWGRSSFDVEHRLLRADALAVEGFETRVWAVHTADGYALKSAPIPPEVVQRFS